MERIDLKGKTCPVPVIETKKLIESRQVDEVEVIVDNPTASENVRRFLGSRGYATTVLQEGNVYRVEGCLQEGGAAVEQSGTQKKVLVYVDTETMGRGDDGLGRVLMRSFLNTLKELEVRPWRIVFVNGGVRNVVADSEYLDILKETEALGVEIVSCGTCLDYFHLKDSVAVGRTSNMFEILTSFSEATNVIRP
ncbi:MAG: SirA-like protein [Syntrophorhabdus sp. PtaB.Bin184]|nr:MAG: SirA-like protein [Syntrophorhabdus sp. PtaB.Bin184]